MSDSNKIQKNKAGEGTGREGLHVDKVTHRRRSEEREGLGSSVRATFAGEQEPCGKRPGKPGDPCGCSRESPEEVWAGG